MTFANPHSYLRLRKQRHLLAEFDAIYLDGVSMVVIVRVLLGLKVRRRSFDLGSLGREVLVSVSREGSRLAVIGGREGVAARAAANLQQVVGELSVVATSGGYFHSSEERAALVRTLVDLAPETVVVGMGAPLQEEFLVELRVAGWNGSGFTCGGFLHQTASRDRGVYYPALIDRFNLRWLYRIFDEPALASRYGLEYPWFVCVFAYDVMRERFSGLRQTRADRPVLSRFDSGGESAVRAPADPPRKRGWRKP